MRPRRLLITLMLFGAVTSTGIGAEEGAHAGHDHSEGVELAASLGYVRLDSEGEDALGFHVHVSKTLGEEGLLEHLSLGLAGEVILADHEHYSAMIPLSYAFESGLVLTVAPGLEWVKHEDEDEDGWESEVALHCEIAYLFQRGTYDFGPVVGYSRTDHDEHYMIGIHMGLHL